MSKQILLNFQTIETIKNIEKGKDKDQILWFISL